MGTRNWLDFRWTATEVKDLYLPCNISGAGLDLNARGALNKPTPPATSPTTHLGISYRTTGKSCQRQLAVTLPVNATDAKAINR